MLWLELIVSPTELLLSVVSLTEFGKNLMVMPVGVVPFRVIVSLPLDAAGRAENVSAG